MGFPTIEEMNTLDWDLKDADTDKYSATIHPYHAKFIPQIPERLIETYTQEQDTVLDPFNGSGTTTMVAGAMNRKGIGVDLNPLACLIARVKCRKYDVSGLESHIDQFLEKAQENVRSVDSQVRLDDFTDDKDDEVPVKIPDFPDQERWYKENVLKQMGALFHLIENVEETKYREFYEICFSGITKKVCRSDEDWTYIGDNMYPDKDSNKLTPVEKIYDVYQHFERRVEKSLKGVKKFSQTDPIEPDIHQRDSRDLSFIEDGVDFAVTSPPYANAVDYARYHRLSFYWFGWPVTETKEEEIGARSKRGRKSAVDDYYKESREVYEEVFDVMSSGARFCIVVGNTQRKNQKVEAVKNIVELCEDIGYNHEGEIERELSRQSMSQKEIQKEYIIVLSKP